MTADFRHSLDQYLASVEQAPACIDAEGNLAFQAGEELVAYAALLPDGRLELFAGVGYVSAELLQFIAEMDEDDEFDPGAPRHVTDIMARWPGEHAQWAVEVDRRTGLLSLSMFIAAIPGDTTEWAAVLDVLSRTGAAWSARLQPDAPDLLPYFGPRFPDVSNAVLRC